MSRSLSSTSLSARLSETCLMVKRGDVFFRKELCTTHKSTVFLASYQGKQVAAKQLKIDQELTAEEKEKELLYLIHEVAGLWVKKTRYPKQPSGKTKHRPKTVICWLKQILLYVFGPYLRLLGNMNMLTMSFL